MLKAAVLTLAILAGYGLKGFDCAHVPAQSAQAEAPETEPATPA